jgi:hypothetical protein
MAKGLLIAALDFSGVASDEFNDWYDLEHIPERARVPGFLTLQRWIAIDNPRHSVAIYDLDRLAVLESAAYRAIGYDNLSPWSKRVTAKCLRLLRFEGEQLRPGDAVAPEGAAALLVIGMNPDADVEHEFNEWYDSEHLPALAAVPGVICARRFRAAAASRQRYTALYHLAAPEVIAGAAWKAAAETPWTHRLRPHFQDRLRFLCRPYTRDA